MIRFLHKSLLSLLVLTSMACGSLLAQAGSYQLTLLRVIEIPDDWYSQFDTNPDLYFTVSDANPNIYTSLAIDNTQVPVEFLPSGYVLDSMNTYLIKVYDSDPSIFDPDDFLGQVTISGKGSGHLYDTLNGITGRLHVYYETSFVFPVAVKDETSLLQSLDVYPNPSQGAITLRIATLKPTLFDLEVMDLNGRVLHKENLGMLAGLDEHHLDLSTLPDGIYLLHLHSPEGSVMRKLVLQR